MSKLEHAILFQNDEPTPLGRLVLAGAIRNGRGVEPARPLRVYGRYAVVVIVNGQGSYRGAAAGPVQPVRSGDVLLVFPDQAHWYGPPRAQRWDEVYVTFDGPVFDLWRAAGLLDDARPVCRFAGEADARAWTERLRALLAVSPRSLSSAARVGHVRAFLDLLADLHEQTSGAARAAPDAPRFAPASTASAASLPDWTTQARGLLETDLGGSLDLCAVAAEVGMSYENFRKQFQRRVGASPAQYRTERRIEAARELLRYSPQITNRQVAETLGFADEYHFSKRFKQIAGCSPREARKQTGP